jgi:mannose-1-phosphate guanylyltransferase
VDRAGRVRRLAGHGPGGTGLQGWHFTGLHVLTPRVFDFLDGPAPLDINHHVYPRLLEAGLEVYGHVLEARTSWFDLGTPERYARAHRALLQGQVETDHLGSADPFLGPMAQVQPGVWVHALASLGDARAVGPVWVGEGAVLEPGVHLGPVVSVGPGARVGAGARLERVAVLDGAEVTAGVALEDALVLPGGVVVSTR